MNIQDERGHDGYHAAKFSLANPSAQVLGKSPKKRVKSPNKRTVLRQGQNDNTGIGVLSPKRSPAVTEDATMTDM